MAGHRGPTLDSMSNLLLVGLGGGLGSISRYLLGGWILHQTMQQRFPYGTFAVNLLGCLAIGLLAGMAGRAEWLGPSTRLLLITGFLGGFTTFSAFGLETMLLLRRGDAAVAVAYVLGSVVLGLLAVWLGMKAIELAAS